RPSCFFGSGVAIVRSTPWVGMEGLLSDRPPRSLDREPGVSASPFTLLHLPCTRVHLPSPESTSRIRRGLGTSRKVSPIRDRKRGRRDRRWGAQPSHVRLSRRTTSNFSGRRRSRAEPERRWGGGRARIRWPACTSLR